MGLCIIEAPVLTINIKMLGNLGLEMILVVHLSINQKPSIDADRIPRALTASLLPLWKHFNM